MVICQSKLQHNCAAFENILKMKWEDIHVITLLYK